MNWLQFFFISVLTMEVSCRIQWPLWSSIDPDYGFFNLNTQMLIGTPVQKVNVQLFDVISGLTLTDSRSYKTGFDPSTSTSFVQTGTSERAKKKDGVLGNETIRLNDDQSVEDLPIRVLSTVYDYMHISMLNLKHSSPSKPPTFVEKLLEKQKEKTLIFVFNEIGSSYSTPYNGQLILGEAPDDVCASKWTIIPEFLPEYADVHWIFHVDSYSIGKYSAKRQMKAFIAFQMTSMSLESEVYDDVLWALGGFESGQIPCDSTKNITFLVGDYPITLTPAQYILKKEDGTCFLNADKGPALNVFPVQVLSNKCFMYDYANNKIGIANRVL